MPINDDANIDSICGEFFSCSVSYTVLHQVCVPKVKNDAAMLATIIYIYSAVKDEAAMLATKRSIYSGINSQAAMMSVVSLRTVAASSSGTAFIRACA